MTKSRYYHEYAQKPASDHDRAARIRCLGHACGGKLFDSADRVYQRLCRTCRGQPEGLTSAGVIGSGWNRGSRGA